MIEPYFDQWMKTRKELSKKESSYSSFLDAWKLLEGFEKAAFLPFSVSLAMVLSLGVLVAFDVSYLGAYGIAFVAFVVFAILLNYAVLHRNRRIPGWRLDKDAEATSALKASMRSLGLTNREQIRIVRDEAIRMLDHKEQRRVQIVRVSIDIFVIAAFMWVLNFAVKMLEHNAPFDETVALVLLAFGMAIALVFAVRTACILFDAMEGLPASKLRLFVDDLSRLLVAECSDARSPIRRGRRIRRHRA